MFIDVDKSPIIAPPWFYGYQTVDHLVVNDHEVNCLNIDNPSLTEITQMTEFRYIVT